MDDSSRERIFQALACVGNVSSADVRKMFEIMAVHDLEVLEPIIDDLIEQSELRGAFEILLQLASKKTLTAAEITVCEC